MAQEGAAAGAHTTTTKLDDLSDGACGDIWAVLWDIWRPLRHDSDPSRRELVAGCVRETLCAQNISVDMPQVMVVARPST